MDNDNEPKIVALRTAPACEDIAKTLRVIADEIDSGEYGLLTTAVVVIGHTEEKPPKGDYFMTRERYYTFGMGPRQDPFTIRGMLMAAAIDPIGSSREEE